MDKLERQRPASRNASECCHFRTCPSFWPYLAPQKIDDWYIKRFKSYRVHKQIDTHPDTHTHKHYW